ncbi:MAG: DCC1-like thiol-disulfide oxidoreductase family protein [Chlamydiota bacterium]
MKIVFFDGVCGLCNRFVDFLLRHDKKKRLMFSPLQGVAIQKTKAASFANEQTLVFFKNDLIFVRSRAALEAIATLGGIWRLSKIFLIVPRAIRDGIYILIAKHRYQWFGKKDACRVPTPNEKSRFLE